MEKLFGVIIIELDVSKPVALMTFATSVEMFYGSENILVSNFVIFTSRFLKDLSVDMACFQLIIECC